MDAADLQGIRGKTISMIFQEPLSALSPLQRIGQQLVEALKLHKNISKKDAWQFAQNWLEKVRIPDAEERMFAQGDKIIFLKNDRKLKVGNGTTAKILKVDSYHHLLTVLSIGRQWNL